MIKVIIFDLDGTLYKSMEIRNKFAEAAYHTLSKFKNISLEDAQNLIEDKREELKREHGFSAPYTLTLKSFGVPVEYWHKENVDFFDSRDYLVRNERLKKSLVELKKHYQLTILTNNNKIQAERTLEALGLKDLFDRIFSYNSFRLLKPNPEFFRKAVKDLNVEPDDCLFVGDRYDIDLSPAEKLGMQVYEVKGPEDIFELSDKLVKERSVDYEKIV